LKPDRRYSHSVCFDSFTAFSAMFDFTVLALEGAYPSSVSSSVDVLAAAAALAPRAGVSAPRWRVCSVGGGLLSLQNHMAIQTRKLPRLANRDTSGDQSVWVVPGLGWRHELSATQRLQLPDAQTSARCLARHAQAGGTVAASCSAVFLLHAAGVLGGKTVTTSWWLAPTLQRLAPDCTVDADRMVCDAGSVVTAGAAFAHMDLMLHLLRQRCGAVLADAVARMLLIDARQAQAPFVAPQVWASGNHLVAQLAAQVEAALPQVPSVAALAHRLCMSERTLSRHVQHATGKSTLALVQSVRLQRARALLQNSRLSIEQVAAAVGYQDSTALRSLMQKTAGANPSHYRSKSRNARPGQAATAP
jgi:transcriptional regulator GlxA family with amidase domain